MLFVQLYNCMIVCSYSKPQADLAYSFAFWTSYMSFYILSRDFDGAILFSCVDFHVFRSFFII
jgi:hypothetical protein